MNDKYTIEIIGELPSQNPSSSWCHGSPLYRVKTKTGQPMADCNDVDAARLIVGLLNDDLEWPCGHTAGSGCAECFAALRRTSNTLIEIIDKLLDKLDQKDTEAERRDLTQALHGPISSKLDKPKGTAS